MAKEKTETAETAAETVPEPMAAQPTPEQAAPEAWEDGEPLTIEQRQSMPRPGQMAAPEAVLTPEATRLPAAVLDDVLRYLPALVEIVAQMKEFGVQAVGSSQDYGPVSTWTPVGHFDLTLHATRTS